VKEAGPVRSTQDESTEILRAKYLDYCSAQLAEILLYLSPDEIYTIAQRAARESEGPVVSGSYDRMVQVATRWLSRKFPLPPFEVWAQDYREHPDRYEEYFMGLWDAKARQTGQG
jgi:hypothetical protein